MDALLTAAARNLAAGDVLAALSKVSLRSDPPALALRGIAMAQLGELARARALLRQAHKAFGRNEGVARARCVVADAEIGLALRELEGASTALLAAARRLEAAHDSANALQAWLIVARRALLLGRGADAAAALDHVQGQPLPPALAAMAALTRATLAARTLQIPLAQQGVREATLAAQQSGIAALQKEVAQAGAELRKPAARCTGEVLDLPQVRALLDGPHCVVDGCRRGVWNAGRWQPLARRPLLFTLLRAVGTAWPEAASRDALIASVFRTRHGDDTHRVRLRVEIGRLRKLLPEGVTVTSTSDGYRLEVAEGRRVAVLDPPFDDASAAVAALLADGAAWSSSALALALGISQRGAQRALADLQAQGRVRATGQGRTQRWRAMPLTGFTTILLLPRLLPGD